MTDGYRIIKALGKRGLRGFYFSYSQYKELAKIQFFDDAKSKIVKWGFNEVKNADDVESLVDALQSLRSLTKEDKGCLGLMFLEPLFWIILGFISCSG
ncbi:hypothetical protein [uncultured Desulfosarcina sp.]|uniref:hypothetical protein n=1 Tax=uncultured Desulfosarcina sp. TaxID=218289 RepID=UPI0029C70910|nr:hypothetical protein [uncultured Desulfosarcina sp.]